MTSHPFRTEQNYPNYWNEPKHLRHLVGGEVHDLQRGDQSNLDEPWPRPLQLYPKVQNLLQLVLMQLNLDLWQLHSYH